MSKVISQEVAKAMFDMAAYTFTVLYANTMHEEPDADLVTNSARNLFLNFCEVEGITRVAE